MTTVSLTWSLYCDVVQIGSAGKTTWQDQRWLDGQRSGRNIWSWARLNSSCPFLLSWRTDGA